MSRSITLTFRWPMGHRILGLTGGGEKCRNIHGHNWVADVTFPNDTGKLEFGDVKAAIGDWIDEQWDHGFILAADDPFREYLIAEGLKRYTLDEPPTTEAIAEELAQSAYHLIGVVPDSVHVLEGYRNAATWRNERAR